MRRPRALNALKNGTGVIRPILLFYISILNDLVMIKNLRTAVIAVLAVAAVSCSGPGEVHEYSVRDLEFTLEGPLFAGPNSGQAEIEVDLKEILGEAYADGMRISDARLTSAEVFPNDSLGFADVRAFIVSFASDNADVSMQEAAVKNPLEEGAVSASLDVAPEAELGELMKEGRVYVILDVDLLEDYWDGNRTFKLNYTIDLTIK